MARPTRHDFPRARRVQRRHALAALTRALCDERRVKCKERDLDLTLHSYATRRHAHSPTTTFNFRRTRSRSEMCNKPAIR